MTNAFIVVKSSSQTEVVRDAALTPQLMTDVWFATVDSPLPSRARALSSGNVFSSDEPSSDEPSSDKPSSDKPSSDKPSSETVSLAVVQWETDVIKLWAFKNGALELEYDSSPSFANCTITAPVSTGTGKLGTLFGRVENDVALERLLSRRKGLGFISERERLAQILELIGVKLEVTAN